jgi:hypothetical protein
MATNAWGVPVGGGAWADKVDEGGEEAAPPPPLPTFSEAQAFPSLSAAAAMPQPTKKDKKKGGKAVKMSLSDFQSAAPSTGVFKPRAAFAAGGASRAPLGGGNSFLSNDDAVLKNLPKGPAGYDPEEASNNRLGGGFKEYGGNRGGGQSAISASDRVTSLCRRTSNTSVDIHLALPLSDRHFVFELVPTNYSGILPTTFTGGRPWCW